MREPIAARALYDSDFALWLEEQGRALRERRLGDLDVPNIIEEIEALGAEQRRELGSRIRVVLTHVLKLAYQPARNSRSWRVTLSPSGTNSRNFSRQARRSEDVFRRQFSATIHARVRRLH